MDLDRLVPEQGVKATPYAAYADRPAEFGREVLLERYTEDVQRVMESVRDYAVTVAISANAVGKTHAAAAIATWWYSVHADAQVNLLAAPPIGNLETKLWGELGERVIRHPDVFKESRPTYLRIQRGPKQFIQGITIPQQGTEAQRQASVAGAHEGHLLYCVDEGDNVPVPIYHGIESCMSGGTSRLLIMFNPREEGGYVWELIQSGRANVVHLSAFNHPNVITGVDEFRGAVTREVTVKRINEWTRLLESGEMPDGECFEVPDFLVGEAALSDAGLPYPPLAPGYRRIEDARFAYMVLGQYSTKGSQRHYFSAARPYLSGLLRRYHQRGHDGQLIHRPVQIWRPGDSSSHGIVEVYEAPQRGVEYVLAGDTAKGVIKGLDGLEDRDYFAMAICRRDTGKEVCAYWAREDCTPELYADDVANLGYWYNKALVIVEVNNHGRSTLIRLESVLKYPNIYYRKLNKTNENGQLVEYLEIGFETTPTTKPMADNYLGGLLTDAASGNVRFEPRCPRGIQELLNYGHIATARDSASKAGALVGHDDHVRCYALAAVILIEMPSIVFRHQPKEPTTSMEQPSAPQDWGLEAYLLEREPEERGGRITPVQARGFGGEW